jgi:pyruvate kinase
MHQDTPSLSDPDTLLDALLQLRREIAAEGLGTYSRWQPYITKRAFCISALNLAHYLALRRRELRPLQTALMPWGLSSLGRAEARVMPNLDAVIDTLGIICGRDSATLPPRPRLSAFFRGKRLLDRQTQAVFGPPPAKRAVRIMVTFPTEAATDYDFVRDLLCRGMNCARINCAHDSPAEWEAMIANVRRAEQETGLPCKIHMDLGGPKNRTNEVLLPPDRRLHPGDRLLLRRDTPQEHPDYPIQASCSLPQVLDPLKVGAPVWFDDGKIGTLVERVVPEGVVLLVTNARPKGERLRPDKGINLPNTPLKISALTNKDRQDLDFVAHHTDIIGYSFVQEAADVDALQAELAKRLSNPEKIAIIAKIETRRAVENLPELIVHAAGKQPFGVMIARGDLAVELGYQRLAELQEEILWLCEAAHVPVVWATQVLERLAKKGTPSRAEMTDAAMGQRAECVMLNKGPYIANAVAILDDVLTRMKDHQQKKMQQMRALRSWELDG